MQLLSISHQANHHRMGTLLHTHTRHAKMFVHMSGTTELANVPQEYTFKAVHTHSPARLVVYLNGSTSDKFILPHNSMNLNYHNSHHHPHHHRRRLSRPRRHPCRVYGYVHTYRYVCMQSDERVIKLIGTFCHNILNTLRTLTFATIKCVRVCA